MNNCIRAVFLLGLSSSVLSKKQVGPKQCPPSHPYPYYHGDYCCKTDKEKVYPEQGVCCDGSAIDLTSLCCENDDHVACPYGRGKCKAVSSALSSTTTTPPTDCANAPDINACCQTSTEPNSYIDPNNCWCLIAGAVCCPNSTTAHQTPIDLLPSQAVVDSSYLTNPLTFSIEHFAKIPGNFVNRGSTGASAEFIAGSVPSPLIVSNGPLTTPYNFLQFHCHWDQSDSAGSEHTLNGQSFVLECHLVYAKPPYTSVAQAAASGDPSALAALGFFFNLGATSPFIQQFDGLAVQPFNSSAHVNINIGMVFNEIPDLNSYISYAGGLAFPGCQEITHWINFLTPATLNATQLEWFRSLLDPNGKPYSPHRPVQPLNDRTLFKTK